MKQVLQSYKTGELKLLEVPVPAVKSGGVLVRNVNSLVSVGTEKLMIDLAKKSIIGKARARPDLVKQVISKIKTEGLMETYRQVTNRLDTPVPLGYSCAGKVIEVGSGVDEFKVGDRVACFGSGYASHAEVVFVPKNLCVKIPDNVDYQSATFVALGTIALHGVRTAELTMGENVVVIGLGLLGLIAVQLLKASGCNVFGIDIVEKKVSLAMELGADAGAVIGEEDVKTKVESFSKGYGADAVVIMASTSSNEPIQLASEVCRDKGKIVALGMVGLDVPRIDFYEKELSMIVPRSTGPGVYDTLYEEKGIDYPLPYVRWTERRNMEHFLELVSKGKVRLDKIITHRFKIDEAEKAYEMITKKTSENYIGVLICYDESENLGNKVVLRKTSSINQDSAKERMEGKEGFNGLGAKTIRLIRLKNPLTAKINIGLIGAGLFANTTLLPCLKKIPNINLRGIATATGMSGRHTGDKFGFEYCTSDYKEILDDENIDCVMIATRHNLHAKFVVEALKHGKDVFVEKPLALNLEELNEIIQVFQNQNEHVLMVGFNRRFSPFSVKAKELLKKGDEPFVINCRVNAGFVEEDSWVHDPQQGGGRIIGEVCHFVDIIQYFTESVPTRVYAETISGSGKYLSSDNLVVTLHLKDGSVATITYAANGDKAFPRERVEIFGNNSVALIDNFKSMSFTKNGRIRKKRSFFSVDRGHKDEFSVFLSAVKEGKQPVNFEEYVYTTLTTFKIVESIKKGTLECISSADAEKAGPLVQK